ncbi:MAG: hypothetical protein KAR38_00930 [Calditrichia bacterium]|nr:hypothetical protein [Calditrichia bacterium]
MDFLKKYLNKRMQRAFFMLLLSVFVWMVIKFNRNYETNINIPLKVIGIPQDSTLKYSINDEIKIRVEGEGVDLLRLGVGLYEAEAFIDCQELSDSMVININSPYFDLKVPSSINLKKKRMIFPRILTVVLEKRMEKLLKIKPMAEITTEAGYIVTAVNTTPDTIKIAGPESFLKNLDNISTQKVVFENKKITFNKNIKLDIPSKYHLISNRKKVKLKVEIQKLGEMLLEDVSVQVINVPSYRKVIPLPSSIKLKITGGTDILSKIGREDFDVSIDYNQYRPGKKIAAKVTSGLNIKSVEIEPNEFELIILRR